MHYLIVDTCVWIDLGRKHTEVREKISDLIDRERVRLILPQIIIDEWNKHKHSKIVEAKEASVRGMIKNARTISQYLEPDEADDFKRILDKFQEQGDKIGGLALEEVRAVEYLFNHPSTIRLMITEKVKLQAVDYALAKKPPFRSRNNMADALIMLSAIDYISQENLTNCIFVSSNTTDFSSQLDKTQIHEGLRELFDEHGIRFFSNIGLAINEIEELISIERIKEIETTLYLEAIQQAIEGQRLLTNRVWSAYDEAMRKVVEQATAHFAAYGEAAWKAADFSVFNEAMRKVAEQAAVHFAAHGEAARKAVDFSAFNEAVLRTTEQAAARSAAHEAAQTDVEKFSVYVNYPTNTATIHSTTCRYYENRVADETVNGYWTTPFSSFEDAMSYALDTGKKRVRTCKVCLKDQGR